MHVRIWEFLVRADAIDAFVELYGPSGRWTDLFSRVGGYLGTELLADAGDPSRYLTLDRWDSSTSYARLDTSTEEWRSLDAEGERLTERETFLGAFDTAPRRPSEMPR